MGWEGFFPYYAGYPEDFAESLLASAGLKPDSVVLDPWNGSGTSTYVATKLGHKVIGFDINPVMVVISRARMLPPSEADSLLPLARTIAAKIFGDLNVSDNDPLNEWFAPKTANAIRQIEHAIRQVTVGCSGDVVGNVVSRISGISATLYLSLFATCRSLTRGFRATNPTWVRKPKLEAERAEVMMSEVVSIFVEKAREIAEELAESSGLGTSRDWRISVADTTRMKIAKASVDFVLTSPPYCTRIDYTSATRIELAVLGPLLSERPDDLSLKMIGSVKVPKKTIVENKNWGESCRAFLNRVKNHESKASSTYYYKTHIDYFDKMYRSMRHISRGMKAGSVACLVVQDSYYKDIHNDLPRILSDMCGNLNMKIFRREDFKQNRSMVRVNKHTKVYGRPSTPTEAVLCFEKVG